MVLELDLLSDHWTAWKFDDAQPAIGSSALRMLHLRFRESCWFRHDSVAKSKEVDEEADDEHIET